MKLISTQKFLFGHSKSLLKKAAIKTIAIFLVIIFSLNAVKAQTVYAVSATNNLVSFNAAAPGTILSSTPFTGLSTGQVLEGLDFRPATGQLYALGYNSTTGAVQIYTVKIPTGVASPVGPALILATGMANLSFDFNPTVDRIRLMSSTRQNYRLNPNDGALAATDGTLTYAAGDVNASATPQVVTGAYTNSFSGTATTTLFFYDFANVVGNINPPNIGTLNTNGNSGISANNTIGLDLDISTNVSTGANTAYLSADVTGVANNFYTVNLTNGAATIVGTIGGGKIKEMAVALTSTPVATKIIYAVQGSNLISFNTLNPGIILSTTAITGLGGGETILGIDFRPATGELFALGSASRLYTLNLTTAVATPVGSAGAFTLSGTKFGFDFNPTVDRIRVVSDADQNLRLNPNNGTLAMNDGTLAYAVGDANASTNPQVGAVGYTNSFPGATTTSLFFYDYNLKILGLINPPNDGTLNTIGGTGITALSTGLDLDIVPDQVGGTNNAFLTATITAGSSILYRINLTTGVAGSLGTIGGGAAITTMAVYLPPPAPTKLAYVLSTTGNLVSFSSNNPGTILNTVPLTGITAGQVVEGLDFRPANSLLYAVGYNAATGSTQVYTVNTTTGMATSVGAAVILANNMGKLAVDFNPQADRIRVIGSTGQSYRLNPIDGTLSGTDTQLSYASTDARAGIQPFVTAAAYNNSIPAAASTILYYYDYNLDNFALTVPPASPNGGVLTTIGNSGLIALSGLDLDITTNQTSLVNTAFLTANVSNNSSNFYLVDLVSGETKLLGTFGGGVVVSAMAISLTDAVLPIELTNFAVKKVNTTSELSWTTKTEINNSYFIVERSADGRIFTAISDKLNSKAENGNSTRELNYSYTDFKPLTGINYYRLLQADKDGTIKYSAVLKVTFDSRNEIKLYPNPAVKTLNMYGFFQETTSLQVKLTDEGGRTVMIRNYNNQKGSWNEQLNIQYLTPGLYFLQIADGKEVHTQKVFKQ